MRRALVHCLLLSAGLFWVSVAVAQQTAQTRQRLTLEDIHASRKFAGEFFEGGRWAEEGPVILYIEPDAQTGATHLVRYNLETGQRERLIDGNRLYASDVGRLVQIEDYAYSRDGRRVLIYTDSEPVWRYNTKGFYYLYDIASGTLRPISDRAKGFQMFAKLSPNGRQVAFVRDRNLYLVDLESGQEVPLTVDGRPESIINGTFDWVYEEEFGLRDGWAWSPDGRYIAFFKLDESHVPAFTMVDLREYYPKSITFRYPKAGQPNSEIQIGVIDLQTGQVRFFDTDTWYEDDSPYEYLARMGWTPAIDGRFYVWMFRMNREQNHLELLYGDPATMRVRKVLEERASAWLEVETGFTDLQAGQLTYLNDGQHFVWISERDGYRHLYLYRNDGTLVRQLTQGAWDVTDFHGVDEVGGWVYFTATIEGPRERHLYRVPLQPGASNGQAFGPQRISQEPGTHEVSLSRDFRYYIDVHTRFLQPPVVTLRRISGEQLAVLVGNEALQQRLKAYKLRPPEFFTVPGADGTPLEAYLIKPSDFDSTKQYPLLLYVYGGPGSQTVVDDWGGARMLWHYYLAEELGILVASVDNRGTGARGYAFKTATYRRLGQLEAQDQIAAAKALAQRSYVDPDRIGIWGWSYGGYLTLMAMLYGDGPQVFRVGVSVAPVTDWRLYDTIYTERYMSTPQQNPEGYRLGAPLTYADRLAERQRLLLIHGDLDDNVHFQNAVLMADALQRAGKQFAFMVYPGRNHGIYGGNTRLHLFTLITGFLEENLVNPR